MTKIKYLIFITLLFIFSNSIVFANSIDKITMDIYIDPFGNAKVTETWDTYVTSGTEIYKSYYSIGSSKIKDFEVTLNNTKYTTIDYWDIDSSFEDKRYKAGINYTDNGVELCFGMSKYGKNTYTMTYTITNFISQVNDADMVYWQLVPINLEDKPEYTYIKIYSDFKYSDTLDVWGYGNYGGYAYVYNGYIEVIHEDELDEDEYMTVLVKFPKNTFQTSSVLKQDFDYYLDMAEDGAEVYKDNTEPISFFVTFLTFIFTLGFVAKLSVANKKRNVGTRTIHLKKGTSNVKDALYFRDFPCNNNMFRVYWLACQYKLINNYTDFLGAILLKWLKEGNVESVAKSGTEKSTKAIKLIGTNIKNKLELELYNMMNLASNDGILDNNEFKCWCKTNYKKMLSWFDNVVDQETQLMYEEGLLKQKKRELLPKLFTYDYITTDKIYEQGLQVAGLKKFLNDFSQIKDKNAIEVKLWDEYLMYAQIFGIAKKVAKEFKNLYPDVIPDDYYDDIIFIHTISFDGVNAARAAKSEAESRARSYSSGGGGFSSGGGGGGAFGSGGGGGFR